MGTRVLLKTATVLEMEYHGAPHPLVRLHRLRLGFLLGATIMTVILVARIAFDGLWAETSIHAFLSWTALIALFLFTDLWVGGQLTHLELREDAIVARDVWGDELWREPSDAYVLELGADDHVVFRHALPERSVPLSGAGIREKAGRMAIAMGVAQRPTPSSRAEHRPDLGDPVGHPTRQHENRPQERRQDAEGEAVGDERRRLRQDAEDDRAADGGRRGQRRAERETDEMGFGMLAPAHAPEGECEKNQPGHGCQDEQVHQHQRESPWVTGQAQIRLRIDGLPRGQRRMSVDPSERGMIDPKG